MVDLLALPAIPFTSELHKLFQVGFTCMSVQHLVVIRVLVKAGVPLEELLVSPTAILGQSHP